MDRARFLWEILHKLHRNFNSKEIPVPVRHCFPAFPASVSVCWSLPAHIFIYIFGYKMYCPLQKSSGSGPRADKENQFYCVRFLMLEWLEIV